MPRLQVIVSESLESELNQLKEVRQTTVSKVAKELIELGLKVIQQQESNQKRSVNSLVGRHTEYLIRILSICSNVLRCVYNPSASKYHSEEVEEELNAIRNEVLSYIESQEEFGS